HLLRHPAGSARGREYPPCPDAARCSPWTDESRPRQPCRAGMRQASTPHHARRNFPMTTLAPHSVVTPLHDRGLIARYRECLPVTDATPVVSLNEGSTPLVHSPKLSARLGKGRQVFIKYEGLNPTGSFKDRG